MKIGTIIQWGSNVVPNDWLLCDGSAVSRTTYADLFAIIGTNFGSGDGSTTFNLPDLRGKVAVGKSSETEFDTLGKTGGNKNLQEHSHNFYRQPIYNTEYETGEAVYAQESTTAKLVNAQTQSAGTGDSGNLQPYLVTNYIIKALKNSEIKVSELPIATSFGDSDYTMIVQSGENKKITGENLFLALNQNINNKIITREFTVNNINAEAQTANYVSFATSIPTVSGYTLVSIAVKTIWGAGSGYMQLTCSLNGDLNIYNPTATTRTIGVQFLAIYIKN